MATPKTPTSRRGTTLLALAVTLLVAAALGGLLVLNRVDRPALPATPSVPAAAAADDAPRTVREWADGGGSDRIAEMIAAADGVRSFGSYAQRTRERCPAIGTAAARAERYGPIPDPSAQSYWSRALRAAADAAADCRAMTAANADAYNHRVLQAAQLVKSYSEQTRKRIEAARAIR